MAREAAKGLYIDNLDKVTDKKYIYFVKDLQEYRVHNNIEIDMTKTKYFYSDVRPLYFTDVNGIKYRDAESMDIVSQESLDELSKLYGSYAKIPHTPSGQMRNQMKHIMRTERKYAVMKLSNGKDFDILEQCYVGGLSGKTTDYNYEGDCVSYDIKSSYPAVMYYGKFPAKPFTEVYPEDVDHWREPGSPYIIQARIGKIQNKGMVKSIRKSFVNCADESEFHGDELVSGTNVVITCLSTDFDFIDKFYDVEDVEIQKTWVCCRWEPLPQGLRTLIKESYLNKENDINSKQLLQTIYGSFCFKPSDDKPDKKFKTVKIGKHITKLRELPFHYGVLTAAYARQRLLNVIYALDDAVMYYDTDCVKVSLERKSLQDIDDIMQNFNQEFVKLYDSDDDWLLGQWMNEGTHLYKFLGKKQYFKNYMPVFAGMTIPDGLCVTDKEIVKNGFKYVHYDINGHKIEDYYDIIIDYNEGVTII